MSQAGTPFLSVKPAAGKLAVDGGGLRILMLEDVPSDAELIGMVLRKEGILSVSRRVDTRDAFVLALEEFAPDLVLADYTLPAFDGFSALEIARKKCPDVPFIFVTGSMGEEWAIETIKRGATDYVLKERLSKLAPAVRRALRETDDHRRRREAEEKLRRSEERYRNLIVAAPEIIYSISDKKGIITYLNPAFEKLTGWPVSRWRGKAFMPLIHNDDLPAVLDVYHRGLAGEVCSTEFRVLTRQGDYRDVEGTVAPHKEDGTLQGVFGFVRDITERKRASEAEVARIHAEAASKAKSDFLASMSHELRTPLNSIIGFSEIMEDGIAGPLTPKQSEYVQFIHESGWHLLSLLNDILDLSKVEAGKLELQLCGVSVSELLYSTVMMQKEKAARHGINLALEVGPGTDIRILADPRKFKQIVFNLLSNALKFTKDGGGVRILSKRTDREINGEVKDCIEIAVEDTGIGIKAEDMPKLFTEFTQLQSSGTKKCEGTGLGLALSRKLVELHGGRIWAESEFGKGSRFSFVIPVVAPLLVEGEGSEKAGLGDHP